MLFEAGIVSLVRTVLIIVVFYYGFRLIFRYVLPWILKWFIQKKMGISFGSYKSQSNHTTHSQSHGDNMQTNKSSKQKDRLGDYVEFEEIEE